MSSFWTCSNQSGLLSKKYDQQCPPRLREIRDSLHGYACELISPQVQIPVIRYLHEWEIKRINQRIKELEPERENPIIAGLYQFNVLSKQVIQAWLVENSLSTRFKSTVVKYDENDVEPFRLDEDTQTVYKEGVAYHLTPNPYKVVSFLYEARAQGGDGWKTYKAIKKHTEINAEKMYEVFRGNEAAWKDLIDRPSGQRKYRLKI